MGFVEAILLAIVQGLTEFLPVSSSGHLAVFQNLISTIEPDLAFDVVVHLGTLMAVLVFFRDDLIQIVRGCLRLGDGDPNSPVSGHEWHTVALVVTATLPTAVMGLLGRDLVHQAFENLRWVAPMFLVTGTLLFVSNRLSGSGRSFAEFRYLDAAVIGLAQGCALMPGISRSGITIATALLLGLARPTATRFSFLIAIPAMVGAAVLELGDIQLSAEQAARYATGFVVAALVGYLSLGLLVRMVERQRLSVFAAYTWILGTSLLAWLTFGPGH